MKTVELFCASSASTAICSSMNQRNMVSSAIRSNEHQNNRHGNLPPRPSKTTKIPCSSQIPFSPTTHSLEKLRRKKHGTNPELRRKSSADLSDISISPPSRTSSRYLLSDNSIFDFLSESENETAKALGAVDKQLFNYLEELPVFRSSSARSNESPVYTSALVNDINSYKSSLSRAKDLHAKQSSSSKSKDLIAFKARNKEVVAHKSSSACTKDLSDCKTSSNQSQNQVVELKVSIHCKGCEAKIRKHISRMEGVTTFSIDLATKKVTIVGNVTPLGVLSRVSKVKYAEFWSSPPASSSFVSSPRVQI